MNATLISIGNELLNGSVVNTNAAFIAKSLYEIGIKTVKTLVIPDEFSSIVEALDNSNDIIIITGGLGPTSDDITKKCLAEYVNSSLELHEPTLEHIRNIFQRRSMEVSELNRQQAFVIKGSNVLHNDLGTAPGMYIEFKNKHIFALPGVPFEMKKLITDEVLSILSKKRFGRVFHYRIIHTTGIPESYLQQMLLDWEKQMPKNVQIAYLPEPGNVKIRLSFEGDDLKLLKEESEVLVEQLKQIIGEFIWGFDQDSLVQKIGEKLNQSHTTLSVAESCTGGFLSHLITSLPGSSTFFKGGVISYSNELKSNILGVKSSTLSTFGAVSRETVIEMAEGVQKTTNADYSLAISGIAGPGGATPEKPVGFVWIALTHGGKTETQSFSQGNDRMVIIQRAAISALNMLRLNLLHDELV